MMDNEPPLPPAGEYFLERDTRLSESFLWSLQHIYYQAQGRNAWASNTVPEYISTNPYLAQAYARVVLGFLRDCTAVERTTPGGEEPVTIIELGAGSGRFAFHFLRALTALLEQAPPGLPGFRYVMTDFVESNITAWRSHSRLRSWVEAGKLDFARFNAAEDTTLTLLESGITLTPGSLTRPAVVIANYVFDSLPQDAFTITGGALYAGLLTTTSSQPEHNRADPSLLERITTTFREVPAGPYLYGDPLLDGLLQDYAKSLSDTKLTYPIIAMRCLLRLAALANGRLLALTGDKGYALPGDLVRSEHPGLVVYGTFSMTVNLHAIGRMALALNGRYLHVDRESTLFNICAFLFGQHLHAWPETALAYHSAILAAGPDDLYALQRVFLRSPDLLTLDQVLAFLRLSAWDPWLFEQSYGAIVSRLPGATARQRADMADALDQIWQNFFAPLEDEDFAFDVGVLFETIHHYEKAIDCFHQSLKTSGDHPATYTHLAVCFAALGQPDAAQNNLHQALSLDPSWGPARTLLDKIQ